jgi:type VI secretion system protein VasD
MNDLPALRAARLRQAAALRLGLAGRLGAAALGAWLLAAAASAQGQAAGSGQAPPASAFELTVVGGPDLNPNAQGRPSPVVVRIFDLKSARAFESADFAALFEHPADSLKDAMAAQEELVLRPADIQNRERPVAPGVSALGIAAAFREMDGAVWRLVVPLVPGRRNFILIDVDGTRIRQASVNSGGS